MKKTLGALILMTSAVASFAGTKVDVVDLNRKTTKLVRVDMGDRISYVIDPVACLCLLNDGTNAGSGTVECSKLAAHKEVEKYVAHCK